MDGSQRPDALQTAVYLTLEGQAEEVQRWLANKPGSWGHLAGKAVIAYRGQLGRSLTYEERRTVWRLLWQELTKLK